jgi:hypothetical protein
MMEKLFHAAHEEIPAYPIIKDLFDVFDIRKDGVIDQSEWSSTLKFVIIIGEINFSGFSISCLSS